MFGNNFGTFLTILISDETLQAFSFHIFALGYLKARALHFENVTNADNLILNLSARLDYRLE